MFDTNVLLVGIVEITSSSALSGFWLRGSTIPNEISQLSGGNEVQSSDNQVTVWAPGHQKLDRNVDNISSHCNSVAHLEGTWHSPSLLNISLKLYQDSTCERELVQKQPLPSPYSPSVTSKPSSDLFQRSHLENGHKPDHLGCRLFGIDLKNDSSLVSSFDKKPCGPTMVADGAKDPLAAADGGSLSQSSQEQQQQQLASELSTKGMQKKRVSNPSSRTRTKV